MQLKYHLTIDEINLDILITEWILEITNQILMLFFGVSNY